LLQDVAKTCNTFNLGSIWEQMGKFENTQQKNRAKYKKVPPMVPPKNKNASQTFCLQGFMFLICGPTWNRTKHLLIMSQLL
jgi:hypothetical protein